LRFPTRKSKIENVHLVEITAYSDDDAYTISETMNGAETLQ
jgi:hypothetical protein